MKPFYTCPNCHSDNFYFVKYPDIWCRNCSGYQIVRAISYNEIDQSLDNMDTISPMESRLNDLENIISLPGSIPRKYQYRLQQLEGQVKYLSTNLSKSNQLSIKGGEGSIRGLLRGNKAKKGKEVEV